MAAAGSAHVPPARVTAGGRRLADGAVLRGEVEGEGDVAEHGAGDVAQDQGARDPVEALAQFDQLDEPLPDRLPDRRVGGGGRGRLDLEEHLVRAFLEERLVGAVERLFHVVALGEVGARLLQGFLDPLGGPVMAGEEPAILDGKALAVNSGLSLAIPINYAVELIKRHKT